MKRIVVWVALAFVLIGTSLGTVSAQSDANIDPRFSNQILSGLGYQQMKIEALEDGFAVPSEIEAGYIYVELTSLPDSASYVLFVQPEEGLTDEELAAKALESGAQDIVHEGWVYGGGSFAMNGGSAWFVVNLTPGEWQVAASYMIGEGEEIMTMHPLTVKVSTRTESAPEAVVTIEHNDTEFIIPEGDLPSGPQIYHFSNSGEAPRQMVLWNSPRAMTVEDYEQFFASFESATPAPEIMSQVSWVGYHAIISPGFSVWLELDLEPGNYTTTSWIIDPETGAPALLLGMVDNFTVTEA